MYLGGTSHIVFRIITLLNCIFTYSASFHTTSHKEQSVKIMDEINSTYFNVAHQKQQKDAVIQPKWNASSNQLHISDMKHTMSIPASAILTNLTSEPLPNTDENSSASMRQELISDITSITQFPSIINNSNSNISSDSINSLDDENRNISYSEIIDSYLKNLSILPPLLPLVSTNNGTDSLSIGSSSSSSSSNLPIPQQNLPLLQQKPHSSSSNPKQQHQLSKTESAMLNYIYDQYAPNKHRHYDFRLGPHFEGAKVGGVSNVTVHLNGTAYLNCKVAILQDRTVTWVQRKHNSDKLQLLTVGNHTYSADTRYSVDFQYPNNWRLKITAAIENDEGIYECQISTHPPRLYRVFLTVNVPEVIIVNEFFEPLFDTFYEAASTIQLNCVVKYITMLYSVVHWTHNGRLLNDDIIRGGISDEGANSTLFVARVNKSDSGNYTCSIGPTLYFTTNVHVLNESLAELYHGNAYNNNRNFSFKTITSTVTSLAITTAPMMFVLIWTLYFIGCTSVR
uniref:CSON010974 protein n=1 Tax=Culicoides sonorensis TaxID=179676 RepID=A0A336LKU9_CULSO